MNRPVLRIASCQFPVEPSIDANRREIMALMQQAADKGARVAHFCETALSGYAEFEIPSTADINWNELHDATAAICQLADELNLWVVLGSSHRLGNGHLPHNSLYIINDAGKVVDRYDKRFCTGVDNPEPTMDLCYYTPGNHTVVFEVDGFKCSSLVCYDYRFPELYRDLKRHGVEVVFHSFHNARKDYRTFHYRNLWKDIVPATIMCHAACNHVWISATNSSAKWSLWGAFFVRPDGRMTGKLPVHQTGALISDVDSSLDLWDAPGPWRERAMNGQLHSGAIVNDPRSTDRTCF